MSEQLQEKSLEELLGYKPDVETMLGKRPFLFADNQVPIDYMLNRIQREADLIDKISKHGERAPVSPHLPEISLRPRAAIEVEQSMRQAGRQPEPVDQERLLELFAYWLRESEEARDYFDD